MITLAAVSICLRLWARMMRKVSLQSNDYIIFFSWVFADYDHFQETHSF